jgi:hypothetical protein
MRVVMSFIHYSVPSCKAPVHLTSCQDSSPMASFDTVSLHTNLLTDGIYTYSDINVGIGI